MMYERETLRKVKRGLRVIDSAPSITKQLLIAYSLKKLLRRMTLTLSKIRLIWEELEMLEGIDGCGFGTFFDLGRGCLELVTLKIGFCLAVAEEFGRLSSITCSVRFKASLARSISFLLAGGGGVCFG